MLNANQILIPSNCVGEILFLEASGEANITITSSASFIGFVEQGKMFYPVYLFFTERDTTISESRASV